MEGIKVPPHNLEAERSVLGGILIDGNALQKVLELNLEAVDFYKESHSKILRK